MIRPLFLLLALAQAPIPVPVPAPTVPSPTVQAEERNRQGCILAQSQQLTYPNNDTFRALVLAVCDGTATIPKVTGMKFQDGAAAIRGMGLQPQYEFPLVVTTPPTPAVGAGIVAFQDPPAGTTVKLGTYVRMVISDK